MKVIACSERFHRALQPSEETGAVGGQAGHTFLQHAADMKTVYTQYCLNHDRAEALLDKYEGSAEQGRQLQRGLERIRTDIPCFNIESILIKPVQRILKYPLILNELLKCTEPDHCDKTSLKEAVTIMSDIAAFINESKRRKDIVEKYKAGGGSSLTGKISKINMHSLGKKSSRISQKFLTSLGMDSVVSYFCLLFFCKIFGCNSRTETPSSASWRSDTLGWCGAWWTC